MSLFTYERNLEMTSEERSKVEAATEQTPGPRPLGARENLVLSLKLLAGAGILVLLLWYLDRHLAN